MTNPQTKIRVEQRVTEQSTMVRPPPVVSFRRAVVVMAMIAATACGSMIFAAHAQTLAAVKIGAPAPEFAFTTVDGTPRKLSEFRGRPIMLWLFATWCPTCVAGTIAVSAEFDRLKQAGIQIIQVKLYKNLGYLGPTAEEFAKRHAGSVAPSPDWLWGDASELGSYTYDPRGYPDIYFLIDKDGVVRAIEPAPHVTMDKILAFAAAVE